MRQYIINYQTMTNGKPLNKYRLILNEEDEKRARQRAEDYMKGVTEQDGTPRKIKEIIEAQILLNNIPAGVRQVLNGW